MAYGAVAVTAGTGTDIRTYADAAGDHVQIVREHAATSEGESFWTVTTAGSASVIAADPTRVGVFMTSFATGRVRLRFDATIPTTDALAHTFIDPGDRFLVPTHLRELAISMCGVAAGGTINTHLGIAA